MTYDLKFTLLWERASIRWLLMRALLIKAIASIYRDDSDTVFLGLSYDQRPSNACLPTFAGSNVPKNFHLVITEISGNVPATSEDFRRNSKEYICTFPKIKCPEMFPRGLNTIRSCLKDGDFSVLPISENRSDFFFFKLSNLKSGQYSV